MRGLWSLHSHREGSSYVIVKTLKLNAVSSIYVDSVIGAWCRVRRRVACENVAFVHHALASSVA